MNLVGYLCDNPVFVSVPLRVLHSGVCLPVVWGCVVGGVGARGVGGWVWGGVGPGVWGVALGVRVFDATRGGARAARLNNTLDSWQNLAAEGVDLSGALFDTTFT